MGHLVELSDSLDKAGKTQCSDVVDGLIKNQSITKIAQYVGVIGYVLKQSRAMEQCIRKKRVANSGSMQEVVLDCLKEYQDGQNYNNNDWTAKYAQVIEDSPENFESSHTDMLKVIAEENDLSDHIEKVKEAGKILKENEIEDSLFKAVLADLDQLDKLFKEGDVGQRPFKLAAPRSQRGFWSRLWSPSGSRRGVQKDTELEMDNILEGISTIAQSSQQIRSSISAIQYQASSLGGYPDISAAINNLSSRDWNRTLQAVQSLQTAVSSAPPDTNLFQLRDLAYSISNNVSNVYNQIERMQRNMFNLRQRESVKGRTYGRSAAEEFGHLEMALERLMRNPLDERSLFYSQKLHGRLEDALNMRSTNMGPEFQDWIDSNPEQSQFAPATAPATTTETEPIQTGPATTTSMEDAAQQLSQRLGPGFTNELIRALEQIGGGDYGSESEANNLHSLIQALRTPMSNIPNKGQGNSGFEDIEAPAVPIISPNEETLNPEGTLNPEIPEYLQDLDLANIFEIEDLSLFRDPRDVDASSKIDTLIKIADIADTIMPEIADILDKYIAEHEKEDELPFEFPENALILKEDVKSRSKISIRKRGKTTVNT